MLMLLFCTLAHADVPATPDTSCRCATTSEVAAPLSLGVLALALLRRRR
jgi:MYXO-CTERM domain-containing protein